MACRLSLIKSIMYFGNDFLCCALNFGISVFAEHNISSSVVDLTYPRPETKDMNQNMRRLSDIN